MSIDTIGARSSLSVKSLVDMRAQLDDLQRQLGTGKIANTYAGFGLNRGLAVGLRSQLSALDGFGSAIDITSVRLQVAQTALINFDKSIHTVKATTLNSSFVIDQTGQTADQKGAIGQLDQMLVLLNTRVGDNYIFSGKSPDQPAVETLDHILNGDVGRAGFKQVLSERRQADLGANGLGRLVIPAPVGTAFSVSEDVAGSPFGFKLAGMASTLTGATVSGPAGSPASVSIDLGATNPNGGDTVGFTFQLPDGTTQALTLTATTASPPGPDQFTIGATAAATAVNLQAALTGAVGTLAQTQLAAASAVAASNDFFNVDAANPPRRVNGPPFDTATSLVAGTPANTVTWYTGEAGSSPPRDTAIARIDQSMSVSYGMRANEQGLRWGIQNVAVFAAMAFTAGDPNGQGRYDAVRGRLSVNLDVPQGTQRVSDIEAEIAGAQTNIEAARSRHVQTEAALTDLLQTIEGTPMEEVSAQILMLQTRLQASLQTTALLARTSLVNFL